MSKFLLTGNWEFPAFPLLDKFLGDGLASEKGGVISVEVEEVKDVAPVKSSSLGDGVLTFVNQSEEIKVEGFELIKVEERDGKQAINARELHQKLGCKYQFANWIQERINKYGFVEN